LERRGRRRRRGHHLFELKYLNNFDCSAIFLNLFEFFGIFWNFLESFGIFWNLLEFFGIFVILFYSFGICWNYFGILKNIMETF